jgi:hypothetical protein
METGIEHRLRTGLRTSAEAVTVTDDLPARVDRRITVRRRQALGSRVAVGTLAVAAMGAAVMVAGTDDGSTEVLPPAVGTPSEGTWEPLPEGPISPRFQHAAVWAGDEMIVFGGYDGGEEGEGGAAAYSPATRAWRRLADPPGEVRGASVAVWTGTEVVAFGGDRGAIYDPRADDWRTASASNIGRINSSASHAAWTGKQVLVAGSFGPGEDDRGNRAALYDPATDDWTRLPDAPEALSIEDAVWTGDELVVVGHDPGGGSRAPQRMHALALDPATATWRTLPAPPLAVRGQPLVAWTGHEVVVGGGHDFGASGISGDHKDAAAFDPRTEAWRLLPEAPTAFQGSERYVDVAVDGRVIAFETADPDSRVLVLDPTTGEWRLAPGPNRPELTERRELPGRREAPVVSTGPSALVWGGGVAESEGDDAWGCCRAVGEGALFTPPPAGSRGPSR